MESTRIEIPNVSYAVVAHGVAESNDDWRALHGAVKSVGAARAALWQDRSDPTQFVLLVRGKSASPNDEVYNLLTKLRPTLLPRVSLAKVLEHEGTLPIDAPKDALLSMSVRLADPGMTEELVSDMVGVFENLGLMPGYLGGAITQNALLPEEIRGFAVWNSEDDFIRSVPNEKYYELRLLQRAVVPEPEVQPSRRLRNFHKSGGV